MCISVLELVKFGSSNVQMDDLAHHITQSSLLFMPIAWPSILPAVWMGAHYRLSYMCDIFFFYVECKMIFNLCKCTGKHNVY